MTRSNREALRLEAQISDSKLIVEPYPFSEKVTALDSAEHNALRPLLLRPEPRIPVPASAAARSSPVGGAQSRRCALGCAARRFPISATNSARPLQIAAPSRPRAENSNQYNGNAGRCTA